MVFALRFAISQAGIAARTLTLMQGSEEKKIKECSANRPQARDFRTRALTTAPQERRFEVVKVSYLTRIFNEKKPIGCKYIGTLCKNATRLLDQFLSYETETTMVRD